MIYIQSNKAREEYITREMDEYDKSIRLAIQYNYCFNLYKDRIKDNDVYIVGSGPTEKKFNLFDNGVYIGINQAYRDKRIKFDMLFKEDLPYKANSEEFVTYRDDQCIKFIGRHMYDDMRNKEYVEENHYTHYYYLQRDYTGYIPDDITCVPLADLRGAVFSALQFVLYAGAKRIYLVGFDCSADSALFGRSYNFFYQVFSWLKIREYIDLIGKSDIIISINPVGLKGLFIDEETL